MIEDRWYYCHTPKVVSESVIADSWNQPVRNSWAKWRGSSILAEIQRGIGGGFLSRRSILGQNRQGPGSFYRLGPVVNIELAVNVARMNFDCVD